MAIEVRRSGPPDRPAILDLLAGARGDDLTATERAERGFVQGRIDDELLSRFQEGTGVFVAEEACELVGVAVTFEPDTVATGPPKQAADAAGEALRGNSRFFLYGPAAVAPGFQQRGALSGMLTTLSASLVDGFDAGVAFVEVDNAKSLAVHRHYGMTELTSFEYNNRDYRVFSFSPGELARR